MGLAVLARVSWPARDPGVAVASGGDVLCMHATVLPDDAARIVMPIHDSRAGTTTRSTASPNDARVNSR